MLTGEGLAEACHGADVLIDVTNSPSFEDEPVLAFFTASSTNLVQAARAAGVGHYVALSIVGTDGLPDSGYLRAKVLRSGSSPTPAYRTPSCGRRNSTNSAARSPIPCVPVM